MELAEYKGGAITVKVPRMEISEAQASAPVPMCSFPALWCRDPKKVTARVTMIGSICSAVMQERCTCSGFVQWNL